MNKKKAVRGGGNNVSKEKVLKKRKK